MHSEQSAIPLSLRFARPTLGSLLIVRGQNPQSDPTISSIPTAIMITGSNSPRKGSGISNRYIGDLLHPMAISGLSRVQTELLTAKIALSETHMKEKARVQKCDFR
jgi:hypothetical protein